MKKLLTLFVAITMLVACVSGTPAGAKTAKQKFKEFKLAELKKEYPDYYKSTDDVKIDVFKHIDGSLYLERLEHETSDGAMYYYNFGKYLYTVNGSADKVYIYDSSKNKEYTVHQAYEKGVIDSAAVKTISGLLKNINGASVEEYVIKLKAGEYKPFFTGENVKLDKNLDVKNLKIKDKSIADTVQQYGQHIAGLQKGTTTLSAETKSGKKITCKVVVTTNPKLLRNSKSVKSVSVKKGETVILKVTGMVYDITHKQKLIIKNKYTNTKYAKIISPKSSYRIEVKGLKKGTTTLKIKVNGVKEFKLKVKVK